MLTRRVCSRKRRTSPLAPSFTHCMRIASGITRWFEIIVESAIEATITIEVAEEKPPRNDSSATRSSPAHMGSVSTNMSGFEPAGRYASPAMAIGRTKRLMRKR